MGSKELTVHCSLQNGLDLWNEISWCQHYIGDLEFKVNQMTELNALGASREYRTAEIHRAHLDEFASKERELKLLKNHLELLKGLYYNLEKAYIRIEGI